MLGSRARRFSDWVLLTAAMSSLIALQFWTSLARCGPPLHPKAPPSTRIAIRPKRDRAMQFLRSDGGHICYRKCNDNQRRRDRQHGTHDAVFAALARLGRGLDDARIDALVPGRPPSFCADPSLRERGPTRFPYAPESEGGKPVTEGLGLTGAAARLTLAA